MLYILFILFNLVNVFTSGEAISFTKKSFLNSLKYMHRIRSGRNGITLHVSQNLPYEESSYEDKRSMFYIVSNLLKPGHGQTFGRSDMHKNNKTRSINDPQVVMILHDFFKIHDF